MNKLDRLFVWMLLLLGIAHILSTFYLFQPLAEPGSEAAKREPALWYFSGGVSLCMCAGLNSIRIRYGRAVTPLAWVSLLATVIMLYHLFLVLTVQLLVDWKFLLLLRGPLVVALGGALWANLRFVRGAR